MAERRKLSNGKPELNEGHVKIANELMDQFVKLKITSTQWNILFLVMRETYGYNRKSKDLSVSYISKAVGASEFRTRKAVQDLIQKNILIEYNEPTPRASRNIGINKYYLDWSRPNASDPPEVTRGRGHASDPSEVTEACPLEVTEALPKQRHIKDTIKDNKPAAKKFDWDDIFAD